MKCPHCLVDFNDLQTFWNAFMGNDAIGGWVVERRTCPTCQKFVFHLVETSTLPNNYAQGQPAPTNAQRRSVFMFRPKGIARSPVPLEVPIEIVEDYREACLVLVDSPKASAALSRRCLQNLLRRAAGIKQGDLSSEIQQVLDSGKLPTDIAQNIDAIRHIGNFAAHPNKSTSTGEVVPVEAGEAEWTLDVLEDLFDFYFVRPAVAKAKRDALNQKLQDAGKPPLKQTP